MVAAVAGVSRVGATPALATTGSATAKVATMRSPSISKTRDPDIGDLASAAAGTQQSTRRPMQERRQVCCTRPGNDSGLHDCRNAQPNGRCDLSDDGTDTELDGRPRNDDARGADY